MTSPAQQAAPLLAGLDVSRFQGTIDWPAVVDAGAAARDPIAIVYYRLTIGSSFVDRLAERNRAGARSAGCRVGAYHVLTADPVAEQVDAFLRALGPDREALPAMLPPALDLERDDAGAGVFAGRRALEWLCAVADALSVDPVVYTGPAYALANGLGELLDLARFPLWIAHYGVSAPHVPAPWDAWTGWQYSGTGTSPGIVGHVDRSWWRRYPG